MALAVAVSEKLISKNSRVFFATHLTTLGKFVEVLAFYPPLTTFVTAQLLNRRYHKDVMTMSIHLQAHTQAGGQNGPQIILPHTVAAGPVQNEDYGIELARLVLARPVADKAEDILKVLRDSQTRARSEQNPKEARQNRLLLAVHSLTREAINYNLGDAAFASYIRRLRNEFTLTMCVHDDEEEEEEEEAEEEEDEDEEDEEEEEQGEQGEQEQEEQEEDEDEEEEEQEQEEQ